MPRQPRLRQKTVGSSTYWFTAAGGDRYFGNVAEVSYTDAKKRFAAHLASLAEAPKADNGLTVAHLVEKFLEWVAGHRGPRTYEGRRGHLNKFGNFKVGGKPLFDLAADKVRSADLEAFLAHVRKAERGPQTVLHHETSVRCCWNWAARHPSPTPYLPITYRPFAAVERTRVPHRALTEDDLITDGEVHALFEAAKVDLDGFHAFGPKGRRDRNPYEGFSDMLRCYYHTGARTGELAQVTVNDLLKKTRQIVLGSHKTSRTQRTPQIRRITLNEEAMDIVLRQGKGKSGDDRIFTNSDGKPWAVRSLDARFRRVKEVAARLGFAKVRTEITIYDFRHLWISEALMAGNDYATVAKMAGTSVAVIERTYAHFRNEHLHEAQDRLDLARNQRAAAKASRRSGCA